LVSAAMGHISTVPAIWSNDSSTRLSNVVASPLATTSSRPTTSPSSSLHQSDCGCALMSPRPRLVWGSPRISSKFAREDRSRFREAVSSAGGRRNNLRRRRHHFLPGPKSP
jgi:hypothetical protein